MFVSSELKSLHFWCSFCVLRSSGDSSCPGSDISLCPTIWADTYMVLYWCLFVSWFIVGMHFYVTSLQFIREGMNVKVCEIRCQVMSVKALGIALKLTFAGMNQLIYPQTWVFAMVVLVCVLTQMNYLNKVLCGDFVDLVLSECMVFFSSSLMVHILVLILLFY